MKPAPRQLGRIRSDLPLTKFLGTLLAYTPAQVRAADHEKAAARFGINPDHAAGYIRQQRELRITA